MKTVFISVFCLLLSTCTLSAHVPDATKELNTFQDKIALQEAQMMFAKAFELYYANKTDEMISSYHELIDRFGNSTNREIEAIIAQAMYNLALGYKSKNDVKAEKRLYERIVSRFINSKDEYIEYVTAISLFSISSIAFNANDTKSEIEIYKKFIDRFENTSNENIYNFLATAMTSLGYEYSAMNETAKAIDIYNRLTDKFEDSQEEYIQTLVAAGSINFGINQVHSGNLKDGLKTFQRIIERFQNSTNTDIMQSVSMAVVNTIEIEICNGIAPSFSDKNEKLAKQREYSTFMYEFLQILYAANNKAQTKELKELKEKYSDFGFKKVDSAFDFSDLNNWQSQLKSPKKEWVKECIDVLREFAEK
ncbi:MAG: tetratricopeptide repeat protein [Campylobacteraceae bacterium]|jgi:tetratricopeptide (TPR) repeat protein|nr:tetratricopeptide repeat protein [Campylobacteraceae bacterium]